MKQTCQELCVWNDCSSGPQTDDEPWQDIQEMDDVFISQEEDYEG